MGYQDNSLGLRPGRSVEKRKTTTPAPNNLKTAQSGGRGFRTVGAVSPSFGGQVPPTPTPTPTPTQDPAKWEIVPPEESKRRLEAEPWKPGENARDVMRRIGEEDKLMYPSTSTIRDNNPPYNSGLSSYYAETPKMNLPKAPGFGQQLAMNVGGQVATQAIGKGINKFFAPAAGVDDSAYSLSSSAQPNAGMGSLTPQNVDYGAGLGDFGSTVDMGDTLAWETPSYGLAASKMASWVEPTYSLAGATGASSVSGLTAPAGFEYGSQFADVGANLGADVAAGGSSTFSSALPYAPAVMELAQGDVGGAAKSAAGTYAGQAIGTAILPGVGTAIGGVIGAIVGGGSVICTELVCRKDATLIDLSLEIQYIKTIPFAIVRGYRYWAVPLVGLIRKHEFLYRIVMPITKRFMKECAARGGHGKETMIGKIFIPIGFSVCWVIGQFVRDTEYQHLFTKEL